MIVVFRAEVATDAMVVDGWIVAAFYCSGGAAFVAVAERIAKPVLAEQRAGVATRLDCAGGERAARRTAAVGLSLIARCKGGAGRAAGLAAQSCKA